MYPCPGPIVSPPLQHRLQKRFEHGLSALLAIAAFAGLALMAAQPLPAPGDAGAAGAPVELLPLADTAAAEASTPPRKRTAIRRSRQTLAMPYFSFAAGN